MMKLNIEICPKKLSLSSSFDIRLCNSLQIDKIITKCTLWKETLELIEKNAVFQLVRNYQYIIKEIN